MDHKPSRQGEKSKRYRGYDVKKAVQQNSSRNKPWFWKILALSLLFSAVIIAVACMIAMRTKKQQTDYLSSINESNTLELLLEDHSNITITQSFSGLKDKDDYKTTRFLKTSKKGTLFSYLKTEGLEEDYKEVFVKDQLYRFDGNFTYYYGMVGDDAEKCLEEIRSEVLQLNGTERVSEQTESTDVLKATITYTVQAGDSYTKLYGFETGTEIKKVLTIDKETMFVKSDVESVNDEEFYVYTVTFDGQNKLPIFYRNTLAKKTKRNCVVYYDYQGDKEEKYTYSIPVDTYFTLLDHNNFKVYMESGCTTEFSKTMMMIQNPYTDLTLYLKKDE